MPEYLAPGVYIEELATGPVPIEGVSTSTAGFVGQTVRGPTEPRLVTSWLDFLRWYGGLTDPDTLSYLPFAAKGFFDNGGQRAYVARVHPTGAAPSDITLQTAGAENLVLTAVGPGDLDDRLFAWVGPPSKQDPSNPGQPDPNRFRLVLLYYDTVPETVANGNPLVDPLNLANAANADREEPDVVEDFDDLEFDPLGSDFVLTSLRRSTLVTAAYNPATPTPPRPNDTGLANGERTYVPATNGNSGLGAAASLPAAMTLNDFQGAAPTSANRGSGLSGLEAIDEISLLAAPDEGHSGVAAVVRTGLRDAIVLQCEQLKDRFGILQLAVDAGGGDPASVTPPASTSYAAVYYPWVRVLDPFTSETYLVPPGGHVAGIYAFTDIERGVHKAPANVAVRGIITADLPGNRGPLSVAVTKRQQDILNPRGVNVIRDFRADGRGIRVWGARTMADNAQWKYVNVRRLFMFVEESVEEGTQWVVFEPNDEPTWARVRRSISNFLTSVWRSGALMGATAEEAYFVRCDRTTMTQDDIDNGRLICYVGIAPVKPAEFVIFRFSQKTIEAS
jgi:phage tail sheath protein FI